MAINFKYFFDVITDSTDFKTLAISGDGTRCAIGMGDYFQEGGEGEEMPSAVFVYSLGEASATFVETFEIGAFPATFGLGMNQDGSKIWVGDGANVREYDNTGGAYQVIATIPSNGAINFGISISYRNNFLLVGGGANVSIYNATTRALIKTIVTSFPTQNTFVSGAFNETADGFILTNEINILRYSWDGANESLVQTLAPNGFYQFISGISGGNSYYIFGENTNFFPEFTKTDNNLVAIESIERVNKFNSSEISSSNGVTILGFSDLPIQVEVFEEEQQAGGNRLSNKQFLNAVKLSNKTNFFDSPVIRLSNKSLIPIKNIIRLSNKQFLKNVDRLSNKTIFEDIVLTPSRLSNKTIFEDIVLTPSRLSNKSIFNDIEPQRLSNRQFLSYFEQGRLSNKQIFKEDADGVGRLSNKQYIPLPDGVGKDFLIQDKLLINGQEFDFINAALSNDDASPYWQAEIVVTQSVYLQLPYLKPFILRVANIDYSLVVIRRNYSRSIESDSFAISAYSPIILKEAPYASVITKTWEAAIKAKSAAQEALGLVIDWQAYDWLIPAFRLSATDASPISIVQSIVEEAGLLLQSNPDGSVVVRHYTDLLTPSHALTNTIVTFEAIYSISEATGDGKGFNFIELYDEEEETESINDSMSATTEQLNGVITAAPRPFRTGLTIKSNTNLVQVGSTTVENETVEAEIIEIFDGVGSTSEPIKSIETINWLSSPAGTISFEQDKTEIRSSIQYGLLEITYITRKLSANAIASGPTTGQFLLED